MKDVLIGQGYSLDKMQEIPQDIVKLAEVKSGYAQSHAAYELAKYELDRVGDGVTDEVTMAYSAVESGLEIRQDDGTVLFRHAYADLNNVMGTEAMLYRVGGKTYLVIEENGYMDGSEERFRTYTIYLIDSKAKTIKDLKHTTCVRAYPNPARKGEVVTMEIPIAEDKASQREV